MHCLEEDSLKNGQSYDQKNLGYKKLHMKKKITIYFDHARMNFYYDDQFR